MTIFRAIGFCCWIASQAVAASKTPPSLEETGRTLDHAVQLSAEAFAVGVTEHPVIRRQRSAKMAAEFAAAMKKLGSLLGARECAEATEREGQDIRAKLSAIACDQRRRPSIHSEIERVYVKGVHLPDSRFPRSPEVKAAHATEKYRLAWEYFLLSPEPEGASPLYHFRVGDALEQIRNSVSIVALRHSCQAASRKGVDPDTAEDRQRLALRTLNVFASQEALRAMLDCLSHTKAYPERGSESGWDAESYVYRLLADQENYGNGPEWRKVLASFPGEGLSPAHRKLLERASKALSR